MFSLGSNQLDHSPQEGRGSPLQRVLAGFAAVRGFFLGNPPLQQGRRRQSRQELPRAGFLLFILAIFIFVGHFGRQFVGRFLAIFLFVGLLARPGSSAPARWRFCLKSASQRASSAAPPVLPSLMLVPSSGQRTGGCWGGRIKIVCTNWVIRASCAAAISGSFAASEGRSCGGMPRGISR